MAFFGVELGGEDVFAPDHGAELSAIVGVGGDDARVLGDNIIRVHEIEMSAFGDAV